MPNRNHPSDSTVATDQAWLTRYSPQGWLELALSELARAAQAFEDRQAAAAAASLKRAAGMALNGALLVVPRDDWGRSYVEHLQAVAQDACAPSAVQQAAQDLLGFSPQPGNVVLLRTRGRDERLLEAARTVMAHAYAVVNGSVGRSPAQK